MPKVHNKRAGTAPADAVYIGRPGLWGNPFVIGKDGDREQVIQKYRDSLTPEQIAKARHELKGRDLVCWCSPAACHGDVLLEIANS